MSTRASTQHLVDLLTFVVFLPLFFGSSHSQSDLLTFVVFPPALALPAGGCSYHPCAAAQMRDRRSRGNTRDMRSLLSEHLLPQLHGSVMLCLPAKRQLHRWGRSGPLAAILALGAGLRLHGLVSQQQRMQRGSRGAAELQGRCLCHSSRSAGGEMFPLCLSVRLSVCLFVIVAFATPNAAHRVAPF